MGLMLLGLLLLVPLITMVGEDLIENDVTARVQDDEAEANSVSGTASGDILTGSAGNDLIDALDGDDSVQAGDGEDTLIGGPASDTLNGGLGEDVLAGDAGNDSLLGAEADDVIGGNTGQDTLDGGNGDDTLIAGSEDDLVLGSFGKDLMIGGAGADVLDGGGGDDLLIGGFFAEDADGQGLEIDARDWETLQDLSTSGGKGLPKLDAVQDIPGFNLKIEEYDPSEDGADTLLGGGGDDVLIVARGDQATGGGGADRFVLDGSAPHSVKTDLPVITDYEFSDRIEVLHESPGGADVRIDTIGQDAIVNIAGEPVARVEDAAFRLRAQDVVLLELVR